MPDEEVTALSSAEVESAPVPAAEEPPVDSSPPTPGSADEVPQDWRNWSHHIPEDMKSDETLNRFGTTADVAKAYVEIRKKMGGSIAVPNGDSSKKDIAEFYDKLGRPAESDSYKLPEMELPDEIKVSDETVKWFRETSYNLGLSQLQTENLYREYHSMLRSEHEGQGKASEEYRNETMENLKKDWGASYKDNIDTASRTAQQLFPDDFIEALNQAGVGNDPVILKAFFGLSKKIGGDSIKGTTGDRSIIEEKSLNEQRAELLRNPLYWKDTDLQDKAAKINELIAAKDG